MRLRRAAPVQVLRPSRALAVFVAGALASAVAVAWIDRWLALTVAAWLPPGVSVPASIPDLLVQFVAGISVASLLAWLWTRRYARFPGLRRVSPLIGIAAPASLGLDLLAKWTFGRTQSRTFIDHPSSYAFHWFDGRGVYFGFPSGHMLVATAMVVLVIGVFPRLRALGWIVLVALALALMSTSYHYLGDVIAGWLLGATLAWFMLVADARLRPAESARRPL